MIHGSRTPYLPDAERQLIAGFIAVVGGGLLGVAGFLAITLGVMA